MDLEKKLDNIELQLKELKMLIIGKNNPIKDEAMSLNRVIEIDPLKRSKSTFYSYTRNPDSDFPFRKRGKHIVVLRSEFDEWLLLDKTTS